MLLLSHEGSGTLGLIVNQATEVSLAEALPELGGAEHELFFGGPVALEGLLFVFRSDEPPDGADHVMDDLYYSGDRTLLESLLEDGIEPRELRLFLGHSGWAAGQLDSELLRGSWEVLPADAATVFTDRPALVWPRLSKDGRVTARSSRPLRPPSRSERAEAP